MQNNSKKYGLILPDKNQHEPPTFQASRNVFGNDSDSDDASNKRPVLFRGNESKNKQAKISQEKALLEDPTVYQYDEIYDNVLKSKQKEKAKTKEEKKPQYIEKLIKSANKRKIENERRIERQIQKEREKEGEEFKDKEVFVTSAYKKKLEEMKLEDENEKREEYLESIGDVTKQRDLGGFYRHLYELKLGKDVSDEITDEKPNTSDIKNVQKTTLSDNNLLDKNNKRNYRKRRESEDNPHLSDGEIPESDEEINRVNLEDIKLAKRLKKNDENIDADSDFSIDESSDEEFKKKNDNSIHVATEKKSKSESILGELKSIPKIDIDKNDDIMQKTKSEIKQKIDIWKKRTVGIIFEEALKRYHERKAARGN